MATRRLLQRLVKVAGTAGMGLTLVYSLLFLFSGLAAPVIAAPLRVPLLDPVIVDTTLTPVGNPYTITGVVEVRNGATLTIQPDVILSFNPGSQLIIRGSGRLVANGTLTQPIQFTATNPITCSWQGIQLQSDNNQISYATFAYAERAINIDDSDVQTITFNTFQNNGGCIPELNPLSGAIIGQTDGSLISNNVFTDNNTAVYLSRSGNNRIASNIISGTRANAIFFDTNLATPSNGNLIISNTVHGATGGYGIYMAKGQDNQILGNQVYGNGAGGIRMEEQIVFGAIRNNDVYSNTGPGLHLTRIENTFVTPPTLHIGENLIWDNIGGVHWGPDNSFGGTYAITGNVICRNNMLSGSYNFTNTNAFTVTAAPNWWGTNNPVFGPPPDNADIQGDPVIIDPRIELTATTSITTLPADGVSTATITISLAGGGVTVPPRARTVTVAPPGNVSPPVITLDGNGQGSIVYTAGTIPGPVVITVTDLCASIPLTLNLVITQVDVAISKSSALTQVIPGQPVTYTIAYSNNSAVAATDVVITDALPGGLIWVSDDAPGQGFTRVQTSPLVIWTHPSLPANTSGLITLVAQAPTASCGQPLTNTVTITTATSEADPGNNSAVHSSVTVICADVAISKAGPGGTVTPGQTVTYTITYSNIGQAPADNVVITDVSPITGGIIPLPAVSPLNPSDVYSLTYAVSTDGSICGSSRLTNTVFIRTDTAEVITANNVATSTNSPQVTCLPDLLITKTVASTAPSVGKVTTFTIAYQNIGAYTATGLVITDFLAANVSYVTDTSGLPPITTSNTVRWDLPGVLGPGEVGSFDVGLTLQASACVTSSVSFTNAVQITSDLGDANDATNNSGTSVVIPCNMVDLIVVKNDGVGTGDPRPYVQGGDYITYTISVNNVGDEIATNVVLTETLPTHTTFVRPTSPFGWFQVGSSNQYIFNVGALGSGMGRVVSFVVRVDPNLPCTVTEIVNTVQTDSDGPEAYFPDNTVNEQTPVICNPLQLSKDAQVPCAIPGQLVNYLINVTNTATTTANSLLLTEFLPAGTSFQGPLGVWEAAGPDVYTHSITTLAAGTTDNTPFWVQVDPALPTTTTAITNLVTLDPGGLSFVLTTPIVHDAPDLYVVKNDNIELLSAATTQAIQRVEQKTGPLPWLEAVKRGEVGSQAISAAPGDTISYTIGYGNAGRGPATNVVITETLPANTTFVGPLYWTQVNSTTYVYQVASLAPGSGGLLDFRVRIDDPFPAGTVGVTNTIQIASDALLECDPSDNLNREFTRVDSAQNPGDIYLPIIIKDPAADPATPTPTPTPTATPTSGPSTFGKEVVIDPTSRRAFVSSPFEGLVHTIDLATDSYLQAVNVGLGPTGLAILTATTPSRVLVVHSYDAASGLRTINADTLSPNLIGYVGARPERLTVSWLTQRAFVSNYNDRLAVVDLAGNISFVKGSGSAGGYVAGYGIDMNVQRGLIYQATIDSGKLVIFDEDLAVNDAQSSNIYYPCLLPPPAIEGPRVFRMAAVNPVAGQVFVTSPPDTNKGQTDSKIFVLDEQKLLDAVGAPSASACNSLSPTQRDQLWMATVTLPGATYAGQEGIAINPLTNRAYITDAPANKLFVLDVSPGSIGYLATINNVGNNPHGVEVDPPTNKIYVANAHNSSATNGTVSVVDGASNTVIKTIVLGP